MSDNKIEFTAEKIATIIGGEIVGNPQASVHTLSKIEEGQAGSISFLSNPKYEKYIYSSLADIVIVDKSFQSTSDLKPTIIKVEDPYQAFLKLLEIYKNLQSEKKGIEQPTHISENVVYGSSFYLGAFSYIGLNCKIGNNVKIYPNCYIGDNVTIGDDSVIYAGVKIYRDIIIGKKCILHSGAVIGADGFGFKVLADKSTVKIPHIGNVIVEDNCEIGANTTIDRATMGSTLIHQGVKIDNLVQIAHNVQIGEHTRLSAQSGIAGSTQVGSYCVFGGQAAVADHLIIPRGTKLGAQTGVNKSITEENCFYNGSPAINYRESLFCLKHYHDLPNLVKRIEALEKELALSLVKH